MTTELPPRDLSALFTPTSVAVYGASRDPAKLGHRLLANVVRSGFTGRVVAVNPAARSVLDVPAQPRLTHPVDLALISVPAPAVADAVRDAAQAGCRAAIVLSSGFGETGEAGRALEETLFAIARDAQMPLVGPNCMGVLSRQPDGTLFNGSYFWDVPDRPGPVALLSQSGAFGGMFLAEARRRGLGLARFLSLGNAIDVTETDVLPFLADDAVTGVVAAFAEQVRGGRSFVEVARRVARHKPLVVLKGGKAKTGARAAASHTGSLAGIHGAARAAFARAGVWEGTDSEDFFDRVAMAATGMRADGRRVAILTISGGPGVLAADAADGIGLELPSPTSSTVEALRPLVPGFAALGNPIDLTPQCPAASLPEAIGTVYADPTFDGVVVINCGLDLPEFGEGVAAALAHTGKPTTAYLLDVPQVEDLLSGAGIPLFGSPERAVRAYAGGLEP